MGASAAYDPIKRATDVVASAAALLVLGVPLLIVAGLVRATSPGPAIHWSKRVGRGNALFLMPKFRTMRIDTPQVATHLLDDPNHWLTPIGGFLRRTSLDELPQLISVLKGDMSLVGPRPALFNQDDLVALRTEAGVEALRPGLTGWAQVNGRDELPIPVKVGLDAEYLKRRSFGFDLRILWLTLARVLGPEIRVNAVSPGVIDSRWLRDGVGEAAYAKVHDHYAATAALGRVAMPEDVAEPVVWLLEGADFITGEILMVDGGVRLGAGLAKPARSVR